VAAIIQERAHIIKKSTELLVVAFIVVSVNVINEVTSILLRIVLRIWIILKN
jgi:hypothetical protein